MKPIYFILFLSLFISCKINTDYGQPIIPVLKNLKDWKSYQKEYVRWGTDYQALDITQKPISKKEFLEYLKTGDYIFFRLNSKKGTFYQLYKIDEKLKSSKDGYAAIATYIRNEAYTESDFLDEEGLPFQFINYKDLNGVVYDEKTLKNKTLVLNFWYIRCGYCIKEMPELNELVKKYKKQKDVVFLALTFDEKTDLEKFLETRTFLYNVIPVSKTYISDTLKVGTFPTSMVINKEKRIVKVTNFDLEGIETALKKEIFGAKKNKK